MTRLLARFPHATRGVVYAVKNDFSFQTQFYGGIGYLFVMWVVFSPLAVWEWLIIILSWVLVLITELQNSALEEALDKIHPELHENIGRSKDMVAGAVLIASAYVVTTIVALSIVRFIA